MDSPSTIIAIILIIKTTTTIYPLRNSSLAHHVWPRARKDLLEEEAPTHHYTARRAAILRSKPTLNEIDGTAGKVMSSV